MIFCYFNTDVQNEFIRCIERVFMKIKLDKTIRKNSKFSITNSAKRNSRLSIL